MKDPYLFSVLVWLVALLVHRYILGIIIALVIGWTRLYTMGLDHDIRERRIKEIRSHLFDANAAGRAEGFRPEAIAFDQLRSWLLGIPGDISFRFSENEPALTMRSWSVPILVVSCAVLVAAGLGWSPAEHLVALMYFYTTSPTALAFGVFVIMMRANRNSSSKNALPLAGALWLIAVFLWPVAPPRLFPFGAAVLPQGSFAVAFLSAVSLPAAIGFYYETRKKLICLYPLVISVVIPATMSWSMMFNSLIGIGFAIIALSIMWLWQRKYLVFANGSGSR